MPIKSKVILLQLILSDFFLPYGQCVSTLLVYDRSTLLVLRTSPKLLLNHSLNYETSSPPSPWASIPTYLWHSPAAVPRRKRSRQLGKRAGVQVRLKTLLRANNGSDNMTSGCQAFKRHLSLYCVRPVVPTRGSPSPAG